MSGHRYAPGWFELQQNTVQIAKVLVFTGSCTSYVSSISQMKCSAFFKKKKKKKIVNNHSEGSSPLIFC